MGWLSDTWKDVKKGVSTGWESVKDEVKDVTGIDSLNSAFLTGFGLQSGLGALQGKGAIGEALGPLMGQQQAPPWASGQMTGPLMGTAPASMTMGTGGQPAPQVVQPSAQDLAGLFGESGYQYGGPSKTSTALLQSNPEAYQYQPLMSGVS